MTLFETDRTLIRKLTVKDEDDFFDMMGNPNVMNPIPREVMSRQESNVFFRKAVEGKVESAEVWAAELNHTGEMLGIVALFKNEEGEDEIGYRLREKFWGNGLGTELANGLLNFGFNEMSLEKIIADVYVSNKRSVRILEKLMRFEEEFFNSNDNCIDRRYVITREEFIQKA